MSNEKNQTQKQIETDILGKATTNPSFRKKLIDSPNSVLEEQIGVTIPSGIKIQVLEESPETYYIVLPPSSDGTFNESNSTGLIRFLNDTQFPMY